MNFSLTGQKSNIGVILSTFSFTMMGFLAAVITILFAAVNHFKFKRYVQKGYLSIFLGVYFATMAFLVLNFCVSLVSMGETNITAWAVASTINCLVQVFFVCIGIIFVWKNTADT